MINKNFGVLTDTNVKKQKSDSFLTNLNKERERQNNVSSGGTFKTDYDKNQYQSAFSDVDKLPTTKNTQPKASYNVNADIAKQRAEFVPLVNNAYAPLMENAETRKWNMPKSEVEKAQNLLNTWGYTDWWGKPLKVDGILGSKTRGALEKHIWDGIPTQETLDMQRWLNKNGFTDNDGNALKQDGMLGRKTDATVQNAILKLGESDGDKKDDETAQIRKKLGYDDLLNDAINARATKADAKYTPKVQTMELTKSDMENRRIEEYGNQNIADNSIALMSANNLTNNKKYETPQDFMPDSVVKLAESQQNINNYPNNTVHLNDYFWKSGYKTEDISGVQKVLNSRKGVNLEANGDIKETTAIAIANYAKANNLTLEQASDKLVELGRMYNEVEKIGLSGEEIKQLQIKLNNLGYKTTDGREIATDEIIGSDTLEAINDYAISNDVGLKTAAIDLRDGNTHDKEKQNLESLILDKGKDFEKDEKAFFNYDKVSKLFADTKDVNFDYKNITKVYLLNAEDGANIPYIDKSFGHNALMLVDDKGCGAFFSYYPSKASDLIGNIKGSNSGEMRFKALQSKDVSSFLENLLLSNVVSTDGQLENETYTRTMPFDITSEQGSRMLNRAIEFFVEPGRYSLINSDKDDVEDNKWQCDSVTRAILEIGGIETNGRIWPNWSYNTTKKNISK